MSNKFTIGDLVTLSAAGRKNLHNNQVYGHVGIVLNIRFPSDHPYQIKWIGAETTRGGNLLPMAEYEIKFAKNGIVEQS
tara:strand:- start:14 stop:250 length:237 start_codon:yes stop_codon:yes gene_type:complete